MVQALMILKIDLHVFSSGFSHIWPEMAVLMQRSQMMKWSIHSFSEYNNLIKQVSLLVKYLQLLYHNNITSSNTAERTITDISAQNLYAEARIA